jgi:hypothetical protein
MTDAIILGLNLLGTKAIIVYLVVIVALVAVGLYTRRGAVGR